MNNRELLFVYGTLLEPHVQRNIIGRIVCGKPDILNDYRKETKMLSDGSFPVIISDPGCNVNGCVLSLTSEEIARCDEYEGSEYHRFKVVLCSGIEAWTYSI